MLLCVCVCGSYIYLYIYENCVVLADEVLTCRCLFSSSRSPYFTTSTNDDEPHYFIFVLKLC